MVSTCNSVHARGKHGRFVVLRELSRRFAREKRVWRMESLVGSNSVIRRPSGAVGSGFVAHPGPPLCPTWRDDWCRDFSWNGILVGSFMVRENARTRVAILQFSPCSSRHYSARSNALPCLGPATPRDPSLSGTAPATIGNPIAQTCFSSLARKSSICCARVVMLRKSVHWRS